MLKKKTPLLLFFAIILSCEENKAPNSSSTFQIIQKNIFNPSCVNCHKDNTAISNQSGLVLSENFSYASIASVPPKNISANSDELMIISNEGGLKALTKSYMWEKINVYDREHFLSEHPNYGQLMPPSGSFLPDGQLQFIRSWIESGAPEFGIVADEKLLMDTNIYVLPKFTSLSPPQEGFQLHLGPFEVQPNFEREFFYYSDLNILEETYVNRVEIEMRPGSHHFLLYSFKDNVNSSSLPPYDISRDLRDPSGSIKISTLFTMQFHKFFAGTQWSSLDYKLPEGVALKIPLKFGFDQNSHYVNRTDSVMIGEVFTNIHTIDRSQVKHVAELFDFSNQDIFLPSKKITTLTKKFEMDETVYIGQVFSHAHEKMTEFVVQIFGGKRDKEVIYWTNDWEHPPILNYEPPIQLNSGEGLKIIVTYDNNTNSPVSFGFKSTDEMMILFGWYYK